MSKFRFKSCTTATVLTPEHGDFNDDLAALGTPALAVRLGHGMM